MIKNLNRCQCKHEPGSAVPVDDIKNPICPKCFKSLLPKISQGCGEKFQIIKSEISDCICKVVISMKGKLSEKILNDWTNEYTDKIISAINKEKKG